MQGELLGAKGEELTKDVAWSHQALKDFFVKVKSGFLPGFSLLFGKLLMAD